MKTENKTIVIENAILAKKLLWVNAAVSKDSTRPVISQAYVEEITSHGICLCGTNGRQAHFLPLEGITELADLEKGDFVLIEKISAKEVTLTVLEFDAKFNIQFPQINQIIPNVSEWKSVRVRTLGQNIVSHISAKTQKSFNGKILADACGVGTIFTNKRDIELHTFYHDGEHSPALIKLMGNNKGMFTVVMSMRG